MTTAYLNHLTCRKCGIKVPAYFIGSSTMRMDKIHTDFYCENNGYQTIHFELTICPDCLFVGYNNEFDKFISNEKENFSFEELDTLKTKYPPTIRFMMLAERLDKEHADKYNIASCYLKASQSERMLYHNNIIDGKPERPTESKELEIFCQRKAVQYFLEFIQTTDNSEQGGLLYLIGELLRRSGEFSQSVDYFDKANSATLNDKTFGVYIDDAGNHPESTAKQIRILTSMRKAKSLELVKNIPAKICSFKEKDEAEKLKETIESYGAKVGIRTESEISPGSKRHIALIQKMREFALKNDASNKYLLE